jgi:hypothetical protein
MFLRPFSPQYISFPYLSPSIHPHFLMSSDLPTGPRGALIRAASFNFSPFHVLSPPSGQAWLAHPLSYWFPCPRPILTLFPTDPVKVLP